jgi:hypothetical protein
MKSLVTKDFGITNAENFESMVTLPLASVYVLIGRATAWPNTSDPNILDDAAIETPYDTTKYKNQIFNDGQILKKINGSDIQPVIPRVDWASNEVYVAYDQTSNLFIKIVDTAVSGGTVNVGSGLLNTVNANGINFTTATPVLTVGSIIKIGEENKEVVNVSATQLVVNTAFTSAYSTQKLYKTEISETQYSNKFYVRNSKDQVFKCLFNNNNVVSTFMPEISIGGELPENPYIEAADGYKWKYMYTIPTGLKNKFFTDKYMPVLREAVVYDNATDGRIDIVKIIDGGTGYYGGSTVSNYNIASVSGDGSLANFTVDVTNGVITDINIINGGNNYTRAAITLDDPLKLPVTNTANLEVIIGPQYGHGWDAARELGASDLMISVDFVGDVSGYLPVENDGSDYFRQICLVKNVEFANGVFATESLYKSYTTLFVSNPPVDFEHNSMVYVGTSYATATFTASVIHFDSATNTLIVNNVIGDVDSIENETIRQKDSPSAFAKVFSVVKPDINIFSGELLYIENRNKIIRNPNQTETIKLVVEF